MKNQTLQYLMAQLALLKGRFAKPESAPTQERSELNITAEIYNQYFSHEETKNELKNEGVTVSLGLPFRLEQLRKQEGIK